MQMSATLRAASLFALLLASGAAAALERVAPTGSDAVVEGTLGMLIGDPMPGSGRAAQKIFILDTDDGRSFELDLSDAVMPPEGVHALVKKRIRVRGPTSSEGAFIAPGRVGKLKVHDARPMSLATPKSGMAKAIGTQPYISLLCRYSDDLAEPRTPAFFTTQLANVLPGFDHYFREASYNLINLAGSAATTAWAVLPNPRSFYFPLTPKPSSQFLSELFNDCTAAHNATVNFASYYGINIMLNGTMDDAAWGGSRFVSLDGPARSWPVTWMPYHGETNRFGWRYHAVLAHELSHSFGAPHSESPDGNEYGNRWDVVSSPGGTCAATDANYGCLGQHMNAYAKTLMGSITAGRLATHNTGTQSYNIERLAQPANVAGTYQMVRVNIAGTATRWYTVESRFRAGYDGQLLGDGVIIHEIDTTRANDARLVVPGQSSAAGNGGLGAVWQPGMNFLSAADNVSVTVNSFSAAGTANVTVAPYIAVADTFPPACGVPAGWTVPAGATTGWSASTDSAAVGNCSLKSNAMADPPNDGVTIYRAQIEYTGTFAAGNVTFWARASSEAGYDCLRFTVDAAQQNVGSCNLGGGLGLTPAGSLSDTGWRSFSFPVTAGTHTLRWSYEKDNFARGLDAAWIDSVVLPVVVPGADLAVTQAVNANPAGAGKDVVFTMTITNNGPNAASGVSIVDSYDSSATVVWASPGCVKQGSLAIYACNVGALANGASAQFKLVLRKPAAGSVYSNPTASSTSSDPNSANNSVSMSVPIGSAPAATPIFRYRLYSPVTLEHHFTTDLNEYTVLGNNGNWNREGTVGKVLDNPGSFGGVTAVPYYRLYNNGTSWHHWTTDANEYYTLVQFPGWVGEGVDGYILPTTAVGATQLYRLLYPFVAGLHHWTIDTNEYTTLIGSYGWIGEGGAGFVIQ